MLYTWQLPSFQVIALKVLTGIVRWVVTRVVFDFDHREGCTLNNPRKTKSSACLGSLRQSPRKLRKRLKSKLRSIPRSRRSFIRARASRRKQSRLTIIIRKKRDSWEFRSQFLPRLAQTLLCQVGPRRPPISAVSRWSGQLEAEVISQRNLIRHPSSMALHPR